MTVPATHEIAEIYKSRTICDEKRVAIELDYPVFSGSFSDTFPGVALDEDKWYTTIPSWGAITVAGATCTLAVTDVAGGISAPWMQSRHNLAFPIRRDTDWQFYLRCRFPVGTGFGAFIRLCGRSFRDAEAVWSLNAGAGGPELYCPNGFTADDLIWSSAGLGYRQYRVTYDASAQIYTCEIDQDDDDVYENIRYVAVAGRYVDCIVVGNSTAVQGNLGNWTSIELGGKGGNPAISVTGVAESVVDPQWAAPFAHGGRRFSYLPCVLGGRVSTDIENVVDAAEFTLANQGLNEDMSEDWQQYTDVRFWNRRAIIEMRAGDGCGNWAPWEVRGDMLCAEKQVRLEAGGRCTLTLPMRDRYRAIADDKLVTLCCSDYGTAIPGVLMNKTVAEIAAHIYEELCGLAAAAHNIVATPNNTPRSRNFFRQPGQSSIRTMCRDEAALAVWALRSNAQIQIQEYPWGTGAPTYLMSSAEEILTAEWAESAFDVTSGQQLTFSAAQDGGILFQCTWPPHHEPFYGPVDQTDATVCQASADHDARPVNALMWWMKNRKLGSVIVTAPAQYWADIGDEVEIADSRWLGLRDNYILDGMEISWQGNQIGMCMMRFINPNFPDFLRRNLMP